jgi:hypothetical protein
MIYVNDELLITRNKRPDYQYAALVQKYHETIKDLREKFGDQLRVQTRQKMRVDSQTGFPRYPGTRGMLMEASVATDSGIDNFKYSSTLLKKDDHGNLVLAQPNLLVQRGETYIDIKQNPDLAFYCIHTGVVAPNKEVPGKFHVVDIEADDKFEAAKMRREAKMTNLIFSGIPEANLRMLAKSFGVSNVDSLPLDSVRIELHRTVLRNEKSKVASGPGVHRGIDEFIDSTEVRLFDQVSALVHDAVDKTVLLYNDVDRRWEIDYKDGTSAYILKELSGTEAGNPTEAISTYLVSNQDALRKLEVAMGSSGITPPESLDDIDEEKEIAASLPSVDEIQNETKMAQLRVWVKEILPDRPYDKKDKAADLKEALLQYMFASKAEG